MCDQNIQICQRLTAELKVNNNPSRDKISNKSSIPFFLCLAPLTFPPFFVMFPPQLTVVFISLGMKWADLVWQLAAHPAALSSLSSTGQGENIMKKLIGQDKDWEITYQLLAWANQT